ncbi:PilZ domain-containing protein [Sphingomonas sp. MS122]|uniref:PilZ domain-containing protein n=1 Tax=Sphingomonas sp. MS122 TaxID=3412683 RepID=UPI003C2E8228
MTHQFSSPAGAPAAADDRREIERDEVHYRARGFGPDAQPVTLLIVNISPHGLMARCETPFAEGDRLRVMLPAVGAAAAEVRWCLGGRLGASFDTAIDLASYYELLAQMLKK